MIGFLKKYFRQILKKHKLDFDEATKSKIPNENF